MAAQTKVNRAALPKGTEAYQHPEADLPLRPEIGTQAQFPERYVVHLLGLEADPQAAAPNLDALRAWMRDNFPPLMLRDPLADHALLNNAKARTDILPPLLAAAGFPGLPYTRFHEIAALMRPEEIHPEIVEKLDAIQKALRLSP